MHNESLPFQSTFSCAHKVENISAYSLQKKYGSGTRGEDDCKDIYYLQKRLLSFSEFFYVYAFTHIYSIWILSIV